MVSSAVIGFLSVLIGRWLHLDYSTKLWAMTFVLVVMVHHSTEHTILTACIQILQIKLSPGSPHLCNLNCSFATNPPSIIPLLPLEVLTPAVPCSHAGHNQICKSTHYLTKCVFWGAQASEHSKDAAIVAATRISGIVFGVFISLVLCVVVFPKSATHEAVDNMWHAFADLSALHALAWSGGRSEGPQGLCPKPHTSKC